jgi:hypothetical protein
LRFKHLRDFGYYVRGSLSEGFTVCGCGVIEEG